ncbi:hypothetical protein HYH03_016028 [Edaphochlamys debaryana]|uniref:J domain-containing protein n=1 Tax=Edaphochlamys debaryana TaxID=47281 RepID=A0A835XL40_9CHLO|nr:hypothetical protein HYH03_016028 [Edaphochlamys debaryana]|eukprot:KAG2485242.1 hypothetical protein HYH03_016028 [Edaphochlamys debaryana]
MGRGSALQLALRAAGLSARSAAGATVGDALAAVESALQPCSRSLCTLHGRGSICTPSTSAFSAGDLRRPDLPAGARAITTSSATAASDYYELLGLDRSASEQDIKKAYYAQAKKYHPDTNKDDPAAAARFQELQKAYEVLRDPEKRRMYDTVGREGMDRMDSGGQSGGPGFEEGGFPGGQGFWGFPFGAENIFEQLLKSDPRLQAMFNRVQMPPLRISFMEAVQGVQKTVQVGLRSGQSKAVVLDIPAGVDTGDVLETQVDMAGAGRRASPKLSVTFPIEVLPHPKFRRQGADIYTSLELPLSQALLGTTVRVETLDGGVDLLVPPLTQQGDRLRIRARGVLVPRRGIKGDHYVDVTVQLPRALTPRQRELLIEFQHEEDRKRQAGGQGQAGGQQKAQGQAGR